MPFTITKYRPRVTIKICDNDLMDSTRLKNLSSVPHFFLHSNTLQTRLTSTCHSSPDNRKFSEANSGRVKKSYLVYRTGNSFTFACGDGLVSVCLWNEETALIRDTIQIDLRMTVTLCSVPEAYLQDSLSFLGNIPIV